MMDELSAVAIRLFTEVGFEETSMDDIAEEAGVSRRTVYRHFAAKADLVFEHPRRWLERFEFVLSNPHHDETVRECCERGVTEVAQMIADDPQPVLDAFAVRNANPILGATHASSDQRWAELVFTNLVAEHGEAEMFQSMVCAGALVGATNALILAWSLSFPGADLMDMTRAALNQVADIWPGNA